MPQTIQLSMYQVAAMCGCWWHESKVNPGEYHNNALDPSVPFTDTGVGLGMWTDAPDADPPFYIATAFFNWMSANGYDWWDGNGQLACIVSDSLSTGSMWSYISPSEFPEYAYLNTKYPTINDWLADTQNNNVEELVLAWFLQWESPRTRYWFNYNNNWQKRRQTAYDVFNYLTVHGNDQISGWYHEIGYVIISDQHALDNCVVAWQVLGSGIIPPPGPGPTPTKKKGMPLWMKLRYF